MQSRVGLGTENSQVSTAPKKLKILCFHGFNNNKETFEFMTQAFREKFGHLAEFVILDGTFDIDVRYFPPEPVFLTKGFKPPFKSWFKFFSNVDDSVFDDTMNVDFNDRFKLLITKDEYKVYRGVEESAEHILKAIAQHGPFDGFLGFSQGCAIIRSFIALTNEVDPESYKHI